MSVYFINNATVTDPEGLANYRDLGRPTIQASGGRILVSSLDDEVIEGTPCGPRSVVIRFHDEAAFRAWYDSDEYQAVVGLRLAATTGAARLAKGRNDDAPTATPGDGSVYFIVNARITDEATFGEYRAAVGPTFDGIEHELLVSSLDDQVIENTPAGPRSVVIRFPSDAAFRSWYDSDAYQSIIGLRLAATDGFAVLAKGR